MTLCPDEKLLESYSLGQLDSPAHEIRIGTHVNSCLLCQTYVKNIRLFHDETEQVSDAQIDRMSNTLMAYIHACKPSKSLILRPCGGKSSRVDYQLAADSESLPRYVNVQSFNNDEENIVARIIRDRQSEHLILYLIASETNLFRDARLHIDGIPGSFYLDEQARVILPETGETDLARAAIHLKTPIRSFDLSPIQTLKETILAHGHYLVSTDSLDHIQIEMDEGESGKKVKIRVVRLNGQSGDHEVEVIVIQKGSHVLTSATRQGVAVFEDLDPDRILHIRIY